MIVPKLRFSEFKSEWFKQKIGDFIINHVGGASFTPNDFVKESNFEVIPKKAIMSGGKLILDKENPTFSSEDFYQNNLKNTIDKSYLVTTLRDLVPSGPSIGYIVSFDDDKKYILAQGVYGFRIKDDLNRNFLIQFSNTSKFRTIMQSKMVGSTQVHIRNQDYFDTEIYKPCLEEQTKIAEFLSAVDDKISQLSRQLELLNQYKKGVMQKIFSQEIRFKNDNGEDFGEWEEVQIKDIFKVTRGQVLPVSQVCSEKDDDYKFPVYSSQTKNDGLMGYYTEYLFENAVTWTTDGANAGTVKFRMGKFYCTNVCGVLLSDQGYANKCIAEILNSTAFKYVSYVGNPKLMNNVMSEIPLYIPSSIQEQEKIAGFLTAIDERIDHTTAQLTHTKQWKKGLLQQMFV